MKKVTRHEFEDLLKQVRSLERRVEEQQKQIATLRRRTTTDAGSDPPKPRNTEGVRVPRPAVEQDIIDMLRDAGESGEWVEVEHLKTEARKMGHLKSVVNAVVSRWIRKGYLAGDVNGEVQVMEWPSELVRPGEKD